MRNDEEILDMIQMTDLLLTKSQKKVDEIKLKNLMGVTVADKRKLFFEEVLPLFVAVNILIDRKATLMWVLEEKELTARVNKISKASYNSIKENLELFNKFL